MTAPVKIYHVEGGSLVEGSALGRIGVYLAADYERLEQECAMLRRSFDCSLDYKDAATKQLQPMLDDAHRSGQQSHCRPKDDFSPTRSQDAEQEIKRILAETHRRYMAEIAPYVEMLAHLERMKPPKPMFMNISDFEKIAQRMEIDPRKFP